MLRFSLNWGSFLPLNRPDWQGKAVPAVRLPETADRGNRRQGTNRCWVRSGEENADGRGDGVIEVEAGWTAEGVEDLEQRMAEAPQGTGQRLKVMPPDAVAESVEVALAGEDAGLGMFEPQLAVVHEPDTHGFAVGSQRLATVGEEEEVIDVAQVPWHLQLPLDPVVECVEVEVRRKELAGIGPDGQTTPWRRPVGVEGGGSAVSLVDVESSTGG